MSTPVALPFPNAVRFRPTSFHGHNRSLSRSPERKSLFLAKEVDPFLSNLSPESTLRALQATSTIIQGSSGQDVLAQSIADASSEEREVGIRAALAAQKIKEWRKELDRWPWPSARDRRSGAGFLPPKQPSEPSLAVVDKTFAGYLPCEAVQTYRTRVEDIRDGIEALGLEDIKEHIFSAHAPHTLSARSDETWGAQMSIGKMRDFTALITATVVQALPDLAHINLLLNTWDIRLSVLKEIPGIKLAINSLRSAIEVARITIRNEEMNKSIRAIDIETTKSILGVQVSSLGSKIDGLLDLLEGHEDTLPKSWIDTLENLENEYTAWVEEAEHEVAQNGLRHRILTKQPSIQIHGPDHNDLLQPVKVSSRTADAPTDRSSNAVNVSDTSSKPSSQTDARINEIPTFPLSKAKASSGMHSRKPSLSIQAHGSGHKRDVSEISVAESALSGISDLSNAEIVDARSTQVLASPKISLVENPFRNSRGGLDWFETSTTNTASQTRPHALKHASTASIRVVSKNDVRPVTVYRAHNFDMLGSIQHSPPSTPSKALRQLTGIDPPLLSARDEYSSSEISPGSPSKSRKFLTSLPPSMLETVAPPKSGSGSRTAEKTQPTLPRRSSRRLIRTRSAEAFLSSVPFEPLEPRTPIPVDRGRDTLLQDDVAVSVGTKAKQKPSLTLEDKIKDILVTMPNKIRLADEITPSEVAQQGSASSTRSCTPALVLTLSPAKPDRLIKKVPSGDVRLFHLTRSGQTSDAAPVKLFVRTVGENGERVMVRVGGGWADLAEYLREYSLHHGHRGPVHNQLEVASLPSTKATTGKTATPVVTTIAVTTPSKSDDDRSGKEQASTPKRRFSLGSLSGLTAGRSRKGHRSKSMTAEEIANLNGSANFNASSPPPVPAIPSSYTIQSATVTTETRKNGTTTTILPSPDSGSSSTITTSNTTYTPLGAAGPKSSGRRATSYNVLRQENEAWVEGMVDRARAVSGGSTSTRNITTTPQIKTKISGPTPKSKSSATTPTPSKGLSLFRSTSQDLLSNTFGRSLSSSSSTSTPNRNKSQSQSQSTRPSLTPSSSTDSATPRPKSRMSLGDVGNIRRVFLRRKSEKV